MKKNSFLKKKKPWEMSPQERMKKEFVNLNYSDRPTFEINAGFTGGADYAIEQDLSNEVYQFTIASMRKEIDERREREIKEMQELEEKLLVFEKFFHDNYSDEYEIGMIHSFSGFSPNLRNEFQIGRRDGLPLFKFQKLTIEDIKEGCENVLNVIKNGNDLYVRIFLSSMINIDEPEVNRLLNIIEIKELKDKIDLSLGETICEESKRVKI